MKWNVRGKYIKFISIKESLREKKKEKVCQKIQFSRFENSKWIFFEMKWNIGEKYMKFIPITVS